MRGELDFAIPYSSSNNATAGMAISFGEFDKNF